MTPLPLRSPVSSETSISKNMLTPIVDGSYNRVKLSKVTHIGKGHAKCEIKVGKSPEVYSVWQSGSNPLQKRLSERSFDMPAKSSIMYKCGVV